MFRVPDASVLLFYGELGKPSASGMNPFQLGDSFQDDLRLISLKSQTRCAQTSGISGAQFRQDPLETRPIN